MSLAHAALLVAHPGHELRLHHWLETTRPTVFVLTDGSGHTEVPRLESTRTILRATGAGAGSLLGRFTDRELYRLMLDNVADPVAAATLEMAEALIEQQVDVVVCDAHELYNPVHDLCPIVAALAAECVRTMTGRTITLYDYAVVGSPQPTGVAGERVLRLSDDALERKVQSAQHYDELRDEVNHALSEHARAAFATECLRPLVEPLALPASADAGYERHGEERVRSGLYAEVLRYREHFVPFVERLAKDVRVAARELAEPARR